MDAPEMEMIAELEAEFERLTSGNYHAVIAAAFSHIRGRMDVKHLWTRGDVSYFRVNWWRHDWVAGEERVALSEFVAVEATEAGLSVLSRPGKRAA